MIRVLVAERQQIVREGLRRMLAGAADLELSGEAASGREAIGLARALQPDVIVLDVLQPDMDGAEAIRRLRQAAAAAQVLVLTISEADQHVHGAIQAGALGYWLKDTARADLIGAVRSVRLGLPALHPRVQLRLMRHVSAPAAERSVLERLSPREAGVLARIAAGCSNKQIAWQLGLREGTVKGHVSAILAKLGVGDRTQAALLAVAQRAGPEAVA